MTNQTLANLLALVLLLAGNGRFLFMRRSGHDTLAVLPSFGLLVAAVNIFVFGLSLETFIIFVLAFVSAFWNVRSVLRLFSSLIIDSYSVRLKIICTVNTLITAAAIAGTVYFRPPDYSKTRLPVTQTVTLYSHDKSGNYAEIKEPFVFPSMRVTCAEPSTPAAGGKKVVLFVPPEAASANLYSAFYQKLASEGFYVYAAELYDDFSVSSALPFFMRPFRRAAALYDALFKRDIYEERVKSRGRISETFLALMKVADLSGSPSVYLISDDDFTGTMENLLRLRADSISGCYDISYVENYKTKGLGPIENAEPSLSYALNRTFDRSGYMSSHLAMAVCSFVESLSFTPRRADSSSGL